MRWIVQELVGPTGGSSAQSGPSPKIVASVCNLPASVIRDEGSVSAAHGEKVLKYAHCYPAVQLPSKGAIRFFVLPLPHTGTEANSVACRLLREGSPVPTQERSGAGRRGRSATGRGRSGAPAGGER
jgi:hypothetical protein